MSTGCAVPSSWRYMHFHSTLPPRISNGKGSEESTQSIVHSPSRRRRTRTRKRAEWPQLCSRSPSRHSSSPRSLCRKGMQPPPPRRPLPASPPSPPCSPYPLPPPPPGGAAWTRSVRGPAPHPQTRPTLPSSKTRTCTSASARTRPPRRQTPRPTPRTARRCSRCEPLRARAHSRRKLAARAEPLRGLAHACRRHEVRAPERALARSVRRARRP